MSRHDDVTGRTLFPSPASLKDDFKTFFNDSASASSPTILREHFVQTITTASDQGTSADSISLKTHLDLRKAMNDQDKAAAQEYRQSVVRQASRQR
jgi:hypothetical protein